MEVARNVEDPTGSMNLKARLRHIFETGSMSDMTCTTDDEEEMGKVAIPAHRFVLIMWSKEAEELLEVESELCISELKYQAFHSLLKYLYTETFEVSVEHLIPVLCAAVALKIPAVSQKCIDALKHEITEITAIGILGSAKLIGEDARPLADESLNIILKNGSLAVEDEDFACISHDNLCTLLARDDFEVEELKLFRAVYRWATKQCEEENKEQTPDNHRQVLGPALKLIRFPLMTINDIIEDVKPTGILTERELLSLLLLLSNPPAERPSLPALAHAHGFIDRKRGRGCYPVTVPFHPKEMSMNESGTSSDWRSESGATIKSNLMNMWERHHKSDITFLVGPEMETVYAHKFILSLWSSVFKEYFQRNLQQETMELPLANPSGFRSFLKVLYTEDYEMPLDQLVFVTFFAKEYDVAFIVEKCVRTLKNGLSDNTAVSIYQAARNLNEDVLASTAWSYILRRAFAVVKETDFLSLNHPNLCLLLKQDDLLVGEVQLFLSVLGWAFHQCDKNGTRKTLENLRFYLKNVISLIRYPLMTMHELYFYVAQSGLLTDKEMASLMIRQTCQANLESDWAKANTDRLAFSFKKRKFAAPVVQKEGRSMCNMGFMSDKAITLQGFSFSGMNSSVCCCPGTIYFYSSKEKTTVFTEVLKTEDGHFGREGFTVNFKTPISMRPNEWYISSEMSKGNESRILEEKDRWISVKNRQADVCFQFQVQPYRKINESLEYVVPKVMFSLL